MSFITVITNAEVHATLENHLAELRAALMSASAEVLKKNTSEIIVDFTPWGVPEPQNAPAILIKAETSLHRRELLQPWAEALLTAWQNFATEQNIHITEATRVAVKTVAVELAWKEKTYP